MSSTPAGPHRATRIHVEKNGDLHLTWSDGHESRYRALDLREACRCAACRDEHTGRKRVDRSQIRPDIYPTVIEPVGRYGLQITWNDGHREGIYPWEQLRAMDPSAPRLPPVA